MHRRSLLTSVLLLPFAPGAFAQGAATPVGVVQALYAAHMRAIEARNPALGVLDDDRTLRRFFTPGIARLVQRLRRGGRTTYDALDTDPIADSQDPEIDDLTVRLREGDDLRAWVDARFRAGAFTVTLRYQLSRVDGTWRVADIEKVAARGEEGWRLSDRLRRGG